MKVECVHSSRDDDSRACFVSFLLLFYFFKKKDATFSFSILLTCPSLVVISPVTIRP
jgi:hypothetical protein